MVKSTKVKVGNREFWVFHSPWGYQVLMSSAVIKDAPVYTVSGEKFFKTKASAVKKLKDIVKNST